MKFETLHFNDFFSFVKVWFNKTSNILLSAAILTLIVDNYFQYFLTSLLFFIIRIFIDIDRSQSCKFQAHCFFIVESKSSCGKVFVKHRLGWV